MTTMSSSSRTDTHDMQRAGCTCWFANLHPASVGRDSLPDVHQSGGAEQLRGEIVTEMANHRKSSLESMYSPRELPNSSTGGIRRRILI
jgi:hypothetical protein